MNQIPIDEVHLRKEIAECGMHFCIQEKNVNLSWSPLTQHDTIILGASISFDDNLRTTTEIISVYQLPPDIHRKLTKFSEVMASIIILRTQQASQPSPMGYYPPGTSYYNKVMQAFDDICSKY